MYPKNVSLAYEVQNGISLFMVAAIRIRFDSILTSFSSLRFTNYFIFTAAARYNALTLSYENMT